MKSILNSLNPDYTMSLQFDVIIGNPPYQDPDPKNRVKIWMRFLEKNMELLKRGGILSYITPTTHFWANQKRSNGKLRSAEILKDNHVDYVDFNVSSHFPQVGEFICSYQIQKKKQEGLTLVHDRDGITQLREKDDIYDCEKTRLQLGFFDKFRKLNKKYGKYGVNHDPRTAEHFSEERTEYPTYISVTKGIRYAQTPTNGLNEPKIVLNSSGYFYHKDNPDKYIFYDDGPGVALLMRMISVKDREEAEQIIEYLRSKLVKLFVSSYKTTCAFNAAMYQIPKCHMMSHKELLDEIGLTEEQFVEIYPEMLDVRV